MEEEKIEEAQGAEAKEKTKKKKTKKSRKYGIITKSKKKNAVARATIKTGKGKITINKRPIEIFEPKYVRELIMEPLNMAGEELIKGVDIEVQVKGSGFMSQAIAARSTLAKSLVEYYNDDKLKHKFFNYDKLLLVDDPRRVEAKKPLGSKARRKKQKSKR
ncbi:MAG: 30S ribosomal protein S9 [Candidatus Diapherotrites archaeon]